jgi:hypothetical protein
MSWDMWWMSGMIFIIIGDCLRSVQFVGIKSLNNRIMLRFAMNFWVEVEAHVVYSYFTPTGS